MTMGFLPAAMELAQHMWAGNENSWFHNWEQRGPALVTGSATLSKCILGFSVVDRGFSLSE